MNLVAVPPKFAVAFDSVCALGFHFSSACIVHTALCISIEAVFRAADVYGIASSECKSHSRVLVIVVPYHN